MAEAGAAAALGRQDSLGWLAKERTVAGAGFNRWLVPPAALAPDRRRPSLQAVVTFKYDRARLHNGARRHLAFKVLVYVCASAI